MGLSCTKAPRPPAAPLVTKYLDEPTTTTAEVSFKIAALLIGINCYSPPPHARRDYNLKGCANDVEDVETWLSESLGATNIKTLVSLVGTSGKPSPRPGKNQSSLPTHDAIRRELQCLLDDTSHGDVAVFYYSGHGGRVPTNVPDIKGETGLDETLVPCDGLVTHRHVRDVDLVYVFQKFVQKGVKLIVLLDSCHSGGMAREIKAPDDDPVSRGIDEVDFEAETSAWATPEELEDSWRNSVRPPNEVSVSRNAEIATGWAFEPIGYTMITACHAEMLAWESGVNGKHHGDFTLALLQILRSSPIPPIMSYSVLHVRARELVRKKGRKQVPLLFGEGNLMAFSARRAQPEAAITVVDKTTDGRVCVNAGLMLDVRLLAEFVLTPASDTEEASHSRIVAVATEVLDDRAWLKVSPPATAAQVNLGDSAVVRHFGRTLSFVVSEPLVANDDSLQNLIIEHGKLWLVAGDDGADAIVDVQLEVDSARVRVIICDSTKRQLHKFYVPHVTDKTTLITSIASRAAQVLIHLARFQWTLDVAPPTSRRLSTSAYEIAWKVKRGGTEPETPMYTGGTLSTKDKLLLCVMNKNQVRLGFTVLDLGPKFAVTQITPKGPTEKCLCVEPNRSCGTISYTMSIPEEMTRCTDVFKVFLQTGESETNFRALCLDPLTDNSQANQTRGLSEGVFSIDMAEETLAGLGSNEEHTRPALQDGPESSAGMEGKWTVETFTVNVVKE